MRDRVSISRPTTSATISWHSRHLTPYDPDEYPDELTAGTPTVVFVLALPTCLSQHHHHHRQAPKRTNITSKTSPLNPPKLITRPPSPVQPRSLQTTSMDPNFTNLWLALLLPLREKMLPTTLLLATTTTTLILALYLTTKHARLKSRVTSTLLPASALKSATLASLPKHLLDNPEQYRILYYRDTIPLPSNGSLHGRSDAGAELFTRLMRHNIRTFSLWTPQSWILYSYFLLSPEQRTSFSAAHIAALDFAEGDLVCGVYRVLARSAMGCEMGMSTSGSMGLPESFGGRLVTRVEEALNAEREGEGDGRQWLVTETLQWVLHTSAAEKKNFKLPLERSPMRWMHELASWGLLVSGARWLEGEEIEIETERGIK